MSGIENQRDLTLGEPEGYRNNITHSRLSTEAAVCKAPELYVKEICWPIIRHVLKWQGPIGTFPENEHFFFEHFFLHSFSLAGIMLVGTSSDTALLGLFALPCSASSNLFSPTCPPQQVSVQSGSHAATPGGQPPLCPHKATTTLPQLVGSPGWDWGPTKVTSALRIKGLASSTSAPMAVIITGGFTHKGHLWSAWFWWQGGLCYWNPQDSTEGHYLQDQKTQPTYLIHRSKHRKSDKMRPDE